jgi:uracil phosphoribosyltransferase
MEKVHHIGLQSSILGQYMAEIRATGVQPDRLRFRHNLSRIAEILAYEVSKQLPSQTIAVQTPLGVAQVQQPAEHPVLLTILRAGLAMHEGLLRTFDHADSAYISAFRKHSSAAAFSCSCKLATAAVVPAWCLVPAAAWQRLRLLVAVECVRVWEIRPPPPRCSLPLLCFLGVPLRVEI